MPIDYSKWDNLDVSSSEDEDDKPTGTTPRVTRLDAPSSVTFGGKEGNSISTKASPPLSDASTTGRNPPQPQLTAGGTGVPSSWTDHGGRLETASNPHNPKRSLYWSQDRYSVTLRLGLGDGEKVRSVGVEGILSYRDRHAAVGSIKPRISCVSADSVCLLEGELPHPVHLAEEDSEDGLVDWSVVTGDRRFLVVTLHKAVPMQGLSVWWRRPLTSFPEADLEAIRGGSGGSSSIEDSGGSREFLEAWEEAHKIFREGKQARKKSVI